MPEIVHNREFIQCLMNETSKHKGVPSSWKRTGLINDHGDENVVFNAPDSNSKVYALTYYMGMEIEQAKQGFYVHKLLSILFPYNFPHIYAAFGKQPTLNPQQLYPSIPTGTIREKIAIVDDTHVIDHPFRDVAMFFNEAEIQQDLLLDNQKRNFFIGSDGGEYYGDIIQDPTQFVRLDESFLMNWMNSHKVTDKRTGEIRSYTKEEILAVRNALKRLKHHYSFANPHNARQYEDDGEET